jgi:hypothetical protein
METMKRSSVVALALAAALGWTLPATAADAIIYNGIDAWKTPANGSTFYDFTANPLPAGFFCQRSAPFTGRVAFRGTPLVTGKAGELGGSDTIIHRLDDVRFDARGKADGRLQVRALQLESLAPVETACGRYDVRVRLAGHQPITRMELTRDNAEGGRFLAPLSLNVKVSFVPVGGRGRTLEVLRQIRFPASADLRWTSDLVGKDQHVGAIRVDTDGDLQVDTYLPGTSNFHVRRAADKGIISLCGDISAPTLDEPCHCTGSEQHCTEPY